MFLMFDLVPVWIQGKCPPTINAKLPLSSKKFNDHLQFNRSFTIVPYVFCKRWTVGNWLLSNITVVFEIFQHVQRDCLTACCIVAGCRLWSCLQRAAGHLNTAKTGKTRQKLSEKEE